MKDFTISRWVTLHDYEGNEYTIPRELSQEFDQLDTAMELYNPTDIDGINHDPYGTFNEKFGQYKQ